LAVAVPVSIYLFAAWLVNRSGRAGGVLQPVLLAVLLVLAVAVAIGPLSVPLSVLAVGFIVASLVGISAYRASRLPPVA
jgi:hypothetical protein